MPFYCTLCSNPDESCYISRFCSKCRIIKKIIELNSVDRVKKSLTNIFLRDEKIIENRTNYEVKIEKSNDSYNTRSKHSQ